MCGVDNVEPSTRDQLIDDVQHGRKTPTEAEEEAARHCVGPLASAPDPIEFDPMKEAWWSLPMTIAWILWRSKDQVREHWDKYRLECWDWHFGRWQVGVHGNVQEGWFLKQRPPASMEQMMIAETYEAICGGPPRLARSAGQAKESLWRALAQGVISASGVDTQSRRRLTASPDE
jgi:hypothetical protein